MNTWREQTNLSVWLFQYFLEAVALRKCSRLMCIILQFKQYVYIPEMHELNYLPGIYMDRQQLFSSKLVFFSKTFIEKSFFPSSFIV